MKVLEIKTIAQADGYIYYIKRYKAVAIIEFLSKQASFPVNFSIESNPFGVKTVEVNGIPTDLDYPLLPVIRALKEFIMELENANKLP